METTLTLSEQDIAFGRIDKILSHLFPEHSRNYLHFLFENSAVLLNNVPCKKRILPQCGDTVSISFLPLPEINAQKEDIPLDVLYEDDALLVINKKQGMAVHPAPGSPHGTVVNALLHRYASFTDFEDTIRPGIVHRLDKDTTGALVIAKTPFVQSELSKQFAERTVKKTYLAVVHGKPKEGLVDAPIGRHPVDRKKMCIKDGGKPAQSIFRRIHSTDDWSLLEVEILTGRTHQIRVHALSLRCPVIGDPIYGSQKVNATHKASTQLLHAHTLTFTHPISKNELSITAPTHKAMEKYLSL